MLVAIETDRIRLSARSCQDGKDSPQTCIPALSEELVCVSKSVGFTYT